MARPGMTEGTNPDSAPETTRLDLDPGRNVGTGNLSAGPATNAGRRAEARENAQASDRRDASPASYQKAEKTHEGRPWPAILLGVAAVVIIIVAFMFFWS